MASVHKETRGKKAAYRIAWIDGDKRRRRIRLVGITKKDAEAIAGQIQSLVGAQISGQPVATATAQ